MAWVIALACGCSSRVLGVDDPASGADGDGGDGVGSGDDGAPDCTAREGAARARVVIGEGGIASIEVLTDELGTEPEPLTCDDGVDGCGFELHRLFPLEGLAVGEVSVADGDMVHEIEYCSCCNGEGGGPDESRGSYQYSEGAMTIDAVSDTCAVGSFLGPGGLRIAFAAERCDL